MQNNVIGVLASGRGSNLQAIIEAINKGLLNVEIGVVISDKPNAKALDIATENNIIAICVDRKECSNQQDFEEKIIEGYPLRGYRYKLRESLNRASNIIDPNVNVNRRVIVMATAPTDIFGDMENVGNNQILIKNYD